jgi:formylglycine-generating enzyme required for sulfatase activity
MIVSRLLRICLAFLMVWLAAGRQAAGDGPPPLTMDNLLQLIAAQFGTEEILSQVRSRGLGFSLDDQALQRLERAGANNELAAGLAFTVADVHLGQGKLELARTYFELALQRNPSYALAHFGLGLVARAQGALLQAVQQFSKSLELDPSSPGAYRKRGEALEQLKRFAEAVRDYREAIRVSQSTQDAVLSRVYLADTLARCPDAQIRNADEALKVALEACRLTNFQNAGALDVLAAAYALSGDLAQAVKFQTEALKLAPDGIKALFSARLDAYRAGQPAPQISTISQRPRQADPAGSILEGIFKKMIALPGGEFSMGADEFEFDERPVHAVRLQPFRISATEVTRREFGVVFGVPLENIPEPDLPVEGVTWELAQEFVRRLNSLPGGAGLRLPSEAEWEYAARGGAAFKYGFADKPEALDDFGWHKGNSGERLHLGGERQPNGFGLYDMFGNCSEWCQDAYAPYGQQGGESRLRVMRGGGYFNTVALCRVTARGTAPQDERRRGFGLRLAADGGRGAAGAANSSGPSSGDGGATPITGVDAKIDELQGRLKAKPEDAQLRQSLCRLLAARYPVRHKQRQYEIAISDLKQLIDLDVESSTGQKAEYHRSLAWILATCPIEELRDAHGALEHAEMACALTQWVDWRSLIAMAAAQAELGHFEDAIRRAEEAVATATADVATPEDRENCQRQLKAFQEGKPWREPA